YNYDNIAKFKRNSIHLGNKYCRRSLHNSRSVHVDGGAQWQNETAYIFAYPKIFLSRFHRYRQGCIGTGCTKSNGHSREKSFIKIKRICLSEKPNRETVGYSCVDKQP